AGEGIKVMDFGLAKLVDGEALRKVTDTNVDFAVGTPGYICPEQVRGEEMDHRGDLYSVGVMMYELLTGRLPFSGPSSMDILLAHATEHAPTFNELGLAGWVPRDVEQLVFDCLAKDPEERPQQAREERPKRAGDRGERNDPALEGAGARLEARAAATAPKPRGSGSSHVMPGLPPLPHETMAHSNVPTPVNPPQSREQASLPFHME